MLRKAFRDPVIQYSCWRTLGTYSVSHDWFQYEPASTSRLQLDVWLTGNIGCFVWVLSSDPANELTRLQSKLVIVVPSCRESSQINLLPNNWQVWGNFPVEQSRELAFLSNSSPLIGPFGINWNRKQYTMTIISFLLLLILYQLTMGRCTWLKQLVSSSSDFLLILCARLKTCFGSRCLACSVGYSLSIK